MKKKEWLSLIGQAAFIVFAIMVFFIPTSNAAMEICSGLLFFFFLLRSMLKQSRITEAKDFFSQHVNLALFMFFAFSGLSLLASGDLIGKSLVAWLGKWGQKIFIFYFAQVFLDRKKAALLLKVLLITAFVTVLSGLWQQLSGEDFLRGYDPIEKRTFSGITASFSHYNSFAAFLVAVFFIAQGFLRGAKGNARRAAFLVFLVLIVVCLLLTYSRGGWVAFVSTGLIAGFVLTGRKGRGVTLLFLVLFVGIVVAVPGVRDRVLMSFQPGGDASRFRLWGAAFSMFRQSPLIGTGVGLYMDRLPDHSGLSQQYAHNSYLQILAETGLLGLGSFLWFLGALLRSAYQKLRQGQDVLCAGLFLGLIAFLVHSFFDVHFYSLRLSVFFWVMAGMLWVYGRDDALRANTNTDHGPLTTDHRP